MNKTKSQKSPSYNGERSWPERQRHYGSPEAEKITVIHKPDGRVLVYGPEEKVLEVIDRMRQKGFDVQMEIMHPCV